MTVLGLMGKPNVGKSSFFKAATLKDVEVANYPFTTIKPNLGVAHVKTKCPHEKCNPKRGACIKTNRFVPVEIYDVAGLVPGAHLGKGLGNQFLDDVRRSEVLIMVVDVSGTTDKEGNEGQGNAVEDVRFVLEEFDRWLAKIIKKQIGKSRHAGKSEKMEENLMDLVGLGISEHHIKDVLREITPKDDCFDFATALRQRAKKVIIAANKADISTKWLTELETLNYPVFATSAAYELALRQASEAGFIEYIPGNKNFKIIKKLDSNQTSALKRIQEFMDKFEGTGIQKVLDTSVFELAKLVAVYPVEDENKLTDTKGNILPDCFLMKKESTAKDLAYKIHTTIGDGFIRAVDAKTKRVVGADYELKHLDILRIVSKK
ncbi:MAG: redox-regulated ATPase YchF [Candidatus Altiarchaeota archaeon]|nr:redox-regulated ATPase YchF [Candidatus Altiarchaeota archaeon]